MSRTRTAGGAAAVAVALALGLAACGGSGGSASGTSTSGTTAGTTTSAATTGGEAAGLADRGAALYESKGCHSCHSIDGSSGAGPTFAKLAGSTVTLTDGSTVTADSAYLTESIEKPDAQIVKGFQKGVMSATIAPGSVSQDDARALVAYIQSLGS
jgi:cytochrome c oxidase subunit 2